MKILEKGAREVADKTDKRITTKFYPGGSQGDERNVVRKMKLEQLDGAALTSVGLGLIYSGVRVLELPFMFESVEEIDYVRGKMWPHFEAKFRERGFELLAHGDVGWTYMYANRTLTSLDEIRKARMWAWQDDPMVRALYRRLKISGVPLGVPDVLPALETKRIDGCYGSPLAAVALQWYTQLTHATSMPVAYAVGALVIRKEAFDGISAEDIAVERKVSARMGATLVKRVRKDNARALTAMVKAGITIVDTPPALATEFEAHAKSVWKDLVGKVYTQEELDMVIRYRDEYRAAQRKKRKAAR